MKNIQQQMLVRSVANKEGFDEACKIYELKIKALREEIESLKEELKINKKK
jgi:hypothetical protein